MVLRRDLTGQREKSDASLFTLISQQIKLRWFSDKRAYTYKHINTNAKKKKTNIKKAIRAMEWAEAFAT